jgi:formylglycine-generating enzyme required for sulfatase activity
VTIARPIHLELIRVPAGEFLMGSDPAQDRYARADEQPQHRVFVSEFYIGRYPIVNEQYAVFVRATKHRVPGHWKNGRVPAGRRRHPVVGISWHDAVAFCKWLTHETGCTFRLPTEAEWEKAARGTDGRLYPWGDQWDESKLNSIDGEPDETTPVGQYSPQGDSPYGAADIAGNVWEWCADWHDDHEYQRRAKSTVKDPQGPPQGEYRVLRGCAFGDEATWVRCAIRDGGDPHSKDWFYGLRVVTPTPLNC